MSKISELKMKIFRPIVLVVLKIEMQESFNARSIGEFLCFT